MQLVSLYVCSYIPLCKQLAEVVAAPQFAADATSSRPFPSIPTHMAAMDVSIIPIGTSTPIFVRLTPQSAAGSDRHGSRTNPYQIREHGLRADSNHHGGGGAPTGTMAAGDCIPVAVHQRWTSGPPPSPPKTPSTPSCDDGSDEHSRGSVAACPVACLSCPHPRLPHHLQCSLPSLLVDCSMRPCLGQSCWPYYPPWRYCWSLLHRRHTA